MKNIMEYKGYYTKIEFDSDSKILYGKIEGINDLVNFESTSLGEVENEFRKAVDDYLDFCKEVGKNPNKTYRGTFNIRISPELHRMAAMEAYKENITLNKFIEKAIQKVVYK